MLQCLRTVSNSYGLLLLGLLMSAHVNPIIAEAAKKPHYQQGAGRVRASLNAGWRFSRFTSNPDSLSYDTLKPWMLPLANDFLSGTKHEQPSGTAPGANVRYAQSDFDDHEWEKTDLPHDWAIKGPFNAPGVGGGQGHLPINGVGWYRRIVPFDTDLINAGTSIFLDIDGAMSYAAVWLNGKLVGGWPYGYNSFRLDLTPFATAGNNTLAIRLDNALDSSRWYPGAGIYRNVWLVTTDPVHIAQYGTYVTTPTVSAQSATVNLMVQVENDGKNSQQVEVITKIHALDPVTRKASGDAVATYPAAKVTIAGGAKQSVNGSVTITKPSLWGPPPTQKPNEYIAISAVSINGTTLDTYETVFGIRSVQYTADKGVLINGEAVRIRGTCNHHDLGSLGAAFNMRAAERQIQMLQELGSNALRTSHNPPAPELLEIADRLGFMVVDEMFDAWNSTKVKNDFARIFSDWHEPDLRSFIRRDRNHPSIIAWSVGNEIPEQSSAAGGSTGKMLQDIAHEEDPSRLVTVAMNNANSGTALAKNIDVIGLNYQGEGRGTSWTAQYPSFHSAFPSKAIWSTESASTVSSRGIYIFPVTKEKTALVGDSSGGNGKHVSAYELYAPSWAMSPDKVFEQQDRYPYVAGEFVWTGWDYIGEPTPYDSSRSSYFGIIDLAGFKKDRFFLYQARWRPDLPMAHILPHWTWPDRVGQITPVHVFTSGDEAELFVNDKSAGRLKRGQYDYRLRWDNVTYAPGSIRVVAYKNGAEWASASHQTVGAAAALNLTADRASIRGDGQDLSFVSVAVVDKDGLTVPQASNEITFSVSSGPGKIVTTDNGDPTDKTVFSSLSRKAFSGLALAILKTEPGAQGEIVVEAKASGLTGGRVVLTAS